MEVGLKRQNMQGLDTGRSCVFSKEEDGSQDPVSGQSLASFTHPKINMEPEKKTIFLYNPGVVNFHVNLLGCILFLGEWCPRCPHFLSRRN